LDAFDLPVSPLLAKLVRAFEKKTMMNFHLTPKVLERCVGDSYAVIEAVFEAFFSTV